MDITPEMVEQAIAFRTQRLANAISGKPSNRPAVEQALTRIYQQCEYDAPTFVWCRSLREVKQWEASRPQRGSITSVMDYVETKIIIQVVQEAQTKITDEQWALMMSGMEKRVDTAYTIAINRYDLARRATKLAAEHISGTTSTWWEAAYDVEWHSTCDMYQMLGVTFPFLADLSCISSEVFLVLPCEHVCVCLERISGYAFDDRERFHNDTGPAVSFQDNSGLYYLQGIPVPDYVVERPDTITVAQIDAEQNIEVRRVMTEKMGIGRYLHESGATVVDMDMVPVFKQGDERSMPRALMRDKAGRQYLVGTDGSTQRVYHMLVPPQVRTCKEAHNAIAGFDESKIIANS